MRVKERNRQTDEDAGKFKEHSCKIDTEDGTNNQAKFLSRGANDLALRYKQICGSAGMTLLGRHVAAVLNF